MQSLSIVDGGIQLYNYQKSRRWVFRTPNCWTSHLHPLGGITGIATTRMIGGFRICDLNTNNSRRSVQSVDLVNAGAGYTVAPGVRFIGGGW